MGSRLREEVADADQRLEASPRISWIRFYGPTGWNRNSSWAICSEHMPRSRAEPSRNPDRRRASPIDRRNSDERRSGVESVRGVARSKLR
jgi:hypothetical protein